jgi:hypothetical protein
MVYLTPGAEVDIRPHSDCISIAQMQRFHGCGSVGKIGGLYSLEQSPIDLI